MTELEMYELWCTLRLWANYNQLNQTIEKNWLSNSFNSHILDLLDKEEIKYRSEKRLLGYRNKGKRRLAGNANQPIIINIDDVVDIVHEEASEDIMHLSGAEEGDVYKSVFGIFRSRSVWLITNLFATILASTVVKEFQDIIAEISVLAVLMPIVASMGGTTGNQTLAVVVRALATKELTSRNTLRMIGKEFMVGVVNGFLFACLIGLITWFMFPARHELSAIIAIAMLCNLSLASLAGILIPLTLNRFKVDPAISSGVFLIAMTDSGGYFIFLGLARLILF